VEGQGIVALPVVEGRFRRQIGALTRREGTLPPLAQRFLQVLKESAEQRLPRADGPSAPGD
jgi:DNA-binding transcriptional LysR family regulator